MPANGKKDVKEVISVWIQLSTNIAVCFNEQHRRKSFMRGYYLGERANTRMTMNQQLL